MSSSETNDASNDASNNSRTNIFDMLPATNEKDEEKQEDAALTEWDKVEAAKKESPVTDMPPRQSESWRSIKVKVQKTWMHRAFIYLVYASVAIHLAMLASQLIGVYFYWMTSVEGIMRCYVIAMSICGIFVELEFTQFIRDSAILQVWITRGLFYALIGILAMVENDTQAEGKHWDAPGRAELVFFIELMSYIMVGLGLVYYILGCLCVQMTRNKVYADFEKRGKEIKAAQKGVPFAPPTSPVM